MSVAKRTTVAIVAERKLKLERLAIDASHTTGKPISWTDIVNYLIDNYAKDAIQDIMHSIQQEDIETNKAVKKAVESLEREEKVTEEMIKKVIQQMNNESK